MQMVQKAKSEQTIKPLRNVKSYTSWQVPSIDAESGKIFRQPVEEEEPVIEEKSEELITAEEIQLIKDQAYTEGFENGRRDGLQSAEQEIDQKILLLKRMMTELTNPIQQCGDETKQELLELSFAIARQIVRRELKQDPTQLIAIIRDSLNLLPVGSKNIQILLHPDDASIIREVLSINKDSQDSRWQLLEEPSMERGGCFLKTENSNVDASIDRQIAVLFSRIVGGERTGGKRTDEDNNDDLE